MLFELNVTFYGAYLLEVDDWVKTTHVLVPGMKLVMLRSRDMVQ